VIHRLEWIFCLQATCDAHAATRSLDW